MLNCNLVIIVEKIFIFFYISDNMPQINKTGISKMTRLSSKVKITSIFLYDNYP